MNINDILTTDEVKVSKNSWTIKRNDKTCGVIRNIMPFTTALTEAPAKAFTFGNFIRKLEQYDPKITRADFYIHDNTLYYLYNMKTENFYTSLSEAHKTALQTEYDAAIKRKNAVDSMSSEVNVVRCIKL